jgi:hypothetical protein
VRYAKKDKVRRRVVTQQLVSGYRHPSRFLKRLCPDQCGRNRCYSLLPTHKNLDTDKKIMFLGQKGDVLKRELHLLELFFPSPKSFSG